MTETSGVDGMEIKRDIESYIESRFMTSFRGRLNIYQMRIQLAY